MTASGPNWQHETDYEILRWDDIVVELDERPDPVRLGRGFHALSDFFLTGTAWRYLKACVRYGLFFFFPYLITGLFAGLAWLAGWLAMLGLGYGLATPWPEIGGVLVGIGVFFALFHQPGRRWRLHQALDDWDLARNYMYGRTPTVDARLDRLGELLVQRVASKRYDEIILVGHSLGATLVLQGDRPRARSRPAALRARHPHLPAHLRRHHSEARAASLGRARARRGGAAGEPAGPRLGGVPGAA